MIENLKAETPTNSDNSPNILGKPKETALNSFPCFFLTKFSAAIRRVEGKFRPGKHLIRWCRIVQAEPYSSIKSARLHLKSTVAIGYLAWRIYRMKHGLERKYNEWLYLAYVPETAIYQIRRLKRYIAELPECFDGLIELTDAETKVNFSFKKKNFVVDTAGMLSFKRGQHPNGIIADDILSDPEKKLDISELEKLEKIFKEQVMQMPKEELHVFGTAQDEADLFAALEEMKEFKCGQFPAIIDEARGVSLWPEEWPFERLTARRNSIGEKAFSKEFQCAAVRSTECFINSAKYDALTLPRLKNYNSIREIEGALGRMEYLFDQPVRLNEWAYAGFDIGKKSHPSHLWVLAPGRKEVVIGLDEDKSPIRRKILYQLHSKFMDGWDYRDQVAYCAAAIKFFRIGKLIYDDTRAEFESFAERGDLPGEMEGLSFTAKNKYTMATDLDSMITSKSIRFLRDARQKRQLLSVDNDLKAVATKEGHGDCFFSLCMAVKAYREGQGVGVFTI